MKYLLLILIILTSGCIEVEPLQDIEKSTLTMTVIDVGQGDSILLEFPTHTMLIDAGTPSSYDQISQVLESKNIGTIDYLVLSHHHQDHYGSMLPILTDYKVNQFWDTTSYYSTSGYEKVVNEVSSQNIPTASIETGDHFYIEGATIDILNPTTTSSNPNDESIVMLITVGSQKFLLMGDAENEEEYPTDCDVLKVGHHGSRNANDPDFLSEATPSISIISVGESNSYGLPDEEVVTTLDYYGDLYQTTSGTITVHTDGTTSWVE